MSTGSFPTDPSLALPMDLGAPSMSDGFPAGMMADHHLLLLADDVAADEVEALALSMDLHSGWVGAGRLQLAPGACLLGPWQIPDGTHKAIGLPEWVSQVMVLDCPPERSGPLPQFMVGKDALMDCFPEGQPTGTELLALHRLRDIARRLAGGIRVAPLGQVVVPDPERSTMLVVYSPVWLMPEAAEVLLARFSPGVAMGFQLAAEVQVDDESVRTGTRQVAQTVGAEAMETAWRLAKQEDERRAASNEDDELDGYSLVMPIDSGRSDWGRVELRARGVTELPLSVLGEPWAMGEGALRYVVTWQPHEPRDAFAEYLPPARAEERRAVRALIEQVTGAVLGAVGGVAVDDCGFLVSLEG
ncbi:Uncharacterised protein [Actinomyces bovis]|uniref:Suppressor of fused protein (SUFU) n=1 Tax=Actinomyces bovis TaxID=1658 RepID=A0ABY1VQA1_9ACTO|nr:hypothetical protein [Actinomyces bovis]SPT53577.1 Uncharacterised protein [Actinomyces bovis]VEG55576.1 Uncharacterised protein [Actinomyces israelii]